jgi:hypothetical protein
MDAGTPASIGGIRFAADVAVAPSANGEGTVKIDYAVMYDALHFMRHGDGYRARYEITAILYDRKGRQITGDSWCETVTVATYDETNERHTASADEFLFVVPPGRYNLKLELTSLDTRAVGAIEREVTVPQMVPGELSLSTVVFETDAVVGGEGGVTSVRNPTRTYGESTALLTRAMRSGSRSSTGAGFSRRPTRTRSSRRAFCGSTSTSSRFSTSRWARTFLRSR